MWVVCVNVFRVQLCGALGEMYICSLKLICCCQNSNTCEENCIFRHYRNDSLALCGQCTLHASRTVLPQVLQPAPVHQAHCTCNLVHFACGLCFALSCLASRLSGLMNGRVYINTELIGNFKFSVFLLINSNSVD